MNDLLAGLAFFLIIEGLLYAAAPGFVKSLAAVLPEFADSQLMFGVIVALGIGLFGIWLIRGF